MKKTVLLFLILGFGVCLSSEKTIDNSELNEEKCYIAEIESFHPRECRDLEDGEETVRHQGACTVDDDQTLTCVHGHWSGTDTSVALVNRKKRFFFGFIVGAVVGCLLFCRGGGGGGGGGGGTTIKYPPSFPEPCTPDDIQDNYYISEGENSVVVSWSQPTPTDRDGDIKSVTQVSGGMNGGRFNGATFGKTHYITYKATDEDGLTGHCHFSFTVTELTCDSLPWPSNGARTCDNKNILGSSCHYTCNTGYQLKGSSTVTCGNAASPSWSAIPTCEKITCIDPVYPEHTTAQCSDPSYGYQSVCSMTCDSGYTLKGAYYLQCRADGTWSNVGDSSCVEDSPPPEISCTTPQTFYADRLSMSATVHWQVPTASDDTDDNPSVIQTYGPEYGSELEVGTHIVKYKAVDADGSESEECFIEIRIEEITCEHPLDSFSDQYMAFNCSTPETGYVHGTSCHLSCIAHLPLEGTDTITCEDNGQSEGFWDWGSGDKPFCRQIACPDLDPPINGALVHDSISTRPLRIVVCNDKFDIPDMGTNFNGQILCTDSGAWTPFSEAPDCIKPKHPRFVRLPSEIFYYGGDCGDEATMEEIKTNFQAILDTEVIPYFDTICPDGETCTAEDIVVTCGPIENRAKRSLSWDTSGGHLRSRAVEGQQAIHNIEKRNAETHLLVLEFYIVTALNLTNTTFLDAIGFYDDLQLNILKPAIQELINNGTFDIENFVLKSDSFATPSYGDITCDPNYMLDQTTCKPCPAGYFINQTTSICDKCPEGQYKDDESSSTCSTCPSGYTSLVLGSKSLSDCVKQCSPGTYSLSTVETCSVCPMGYYQDEYGQTTCKQCPTGTTTASTNSSSASDCQTFDSCISSPCNGHTCNNVHGTDVCTCQNGWSGTNCTVPPDLCGGNACENGATCVSGLTNYTCTCATGYSGQFCEISPVDGGWSEWSTTECSKTCGTGSLTRSRACDSPAPDMNGADCVGDSTETVACNTEPCPVCEELISGSGTFFNCTTSTTTGSETCTVYCENGKVLPPGLTDQQSYTCGPTTNYEWDYMENTPSCVDVVGPGNVSMTVSVDYTPDIPQSVITEFVTTINNQISVLPCVDAGICQAAIQITDSTLTIVCSIETTQSGDIQYGDFITSGTPNGALQEIIDAINSLEQTAQYIQNNTNDLFDSIVDGETYTVVDNSLTIDGTVACDSGFVVYDGLCVACPSGTHSVGDACTFCGKGKYQPNVGQTTCISCPTGQTTNSIGSTGSSQCIEETTENNQNKSHPTKPPQRKDNNSSTVTIAIIISVVALIIAVTAIILVYFKKIKPNLAVNCSNANLQHEAVNTRYCPRPRSQISRCVTSLSDVDINDYQNGSDVIQTPHYSRMPSSTSTYLTPDNISLKCTSPPPPYEVNLPRYQEKEFPSVDSTYAVIVDKEVATKKMGFKK